MRICAWALSRKRSRSRAKPRSSISRARRVRKCVVGRRRSAGRQIGELLVRPLIGLTPVPRSMPQSVSCVPLCHPEQRGFPDSVGDRGFPRGSLPTSFPRSSDGARPRESLGFASRLARRRARGDSPGVISLAPRPLPSRHDPGLLCSGGVTLRHCSYEPMRRSRGLTPSFRAWLL